MNWIGTVRLLAVVTSVTCVILVTPLSAVTQEADGPILLRNISVIDGTGAQPRGGLDVTLRDGLSASIEPTRSIEHVFRRDRRIR